MVAKLAPLIPERRIYVEPYCGMASLLFSAERRATQTEVLNDLDERVIGLFRVLQDPAQAAALQHRLLHTPYSRAELVRAIRLQDDPDPVVRAWSLFVRINQGFGGQVARTAGNWGVSRVGGHPHALGGATARWLSRLEKLPLWHRRLLHVVLDCHPALAVIRQWDTPETVFYVDPPYIAATRAKGCGRVYSHEMTDEDHAALVAQLLGVQGVVVLSGYDHPICAPLTAAGWRTIRFAVSCAAAGRVRGSGLTGKGAATEVPRTEVVWLSPNHPHASGPLPATVAKRALATA